LRPYSEVVWCHHFHHQLSIIYSQNKIKAKLLEHYKKIQRKGETFSSIHFYYSGQTCVFVWWWIPIHISHRKHVCGGCRFLHFILSHLHHQEELLLKKLSPHTPQDTRSSSMPGTATAIFSFLLQ